LVDDTGQGIVAWGIEHSGGSSNVAGHVNKEVRVVRSNSNGKDQSSSCLYGSQNRGIGVGIYIVVTISKNDNHSSSVSSGGIKKILSSLKTTSNTSVSSHTSSSIYNVNELGLVGCQARTNYRSSVEQHQTHSNCVVSKGEGL
jgi:hypothetical protein